MKNNIIHKGSMDEDLIKAFEENIKYLEERIDKIIEQIKIFENQNIDTSYLENRIEELNEKNDYLCKKFESELKRIREKYPS